MPFDDTTNNGGVYKVWVTPLADFPKQCLNQVGCGGITLKPTAS